MISKPSVLVKMDDTEKIQLFNEIRLENKETQATDLRTDMLTNIPNNSGRFKLVPVKSSGLRHFIAISICETTSNYEPGVPRFSDCTKKKRRTKSNGGTRDFVCNFCQKTYFSYPALYTHKRNKHNIIPITGKQQIFKIPADNTPVMVKFKYSAIENDTCTLSDFLDFLIPIYLKIIKQYFNNRECILYKDNFDYTQHKGYQLLRNLRDQESQRLEIPKPQCKPTVDEILIIYLIYFSKVARDLQMIEMVSKFVILLREHINIVGWDYKKKFVEFGVKVEFRYQGPYTSYNDCQEIPDYINDFISVFLELEGIEFNYEMKDIMDLCQNLCNWLFVNNLTNFKISHNTIPCEGIY